MIGEEPAESFWHHIWHEIIATPVTGTVLAAAILAFGTYLGVRLKGKRSK